MDNSPLISIVLLTFNYWRFLDYCLRSIENQNIKNVEIILVDDWSNDQFTINYLERIKNMYTILHSDGKWPAHARNLWILHSNWDYILFLDADDYLHEDYLVIALNKLKETNADFFYPSFQNFWINNDSTIVPDFSNERLLLNNFIIIESLIKKKSLLKSGVLFDDLMRTWLEDWDFRIRIAEKWLEWVTLPIPLVFIRRHVKSLTSRANSNKNKIFSYIYKKDEIFFKKILSKKQLLLMRLEYLFGWKIWYYISKIVGIIPKKIRNKIKWIKR